VAEQEAWRAAQLAPQAPWYQPAQAGPQSDRADARKRRLCHRRARCLDRPRRCTASRSWSKAIAG
jgi:hypothetical protein